MTLAYYNEIEPKAVAALEQLIREGVIAPGVVDSRSIAEVQAHELRPFQQWHFFAGGGIWSAAARRAGWPDARPLGLERGELGQIQPVFALKERLEVDNATEMNREMNPSVHRRNR